MSVIGVQIDKQNPEFTKCDFTFWMPQYAKFMATQEGQIYFDKLYPLVNQKIFKSIFGSDWEMAMCLGIAHYLTLISQQMQAPTGDSLNTVYGGGSIKGVLESMTVGSFSKSYKLDATLVNTDDAKFWNQTSYGAQLMALYKSKAVPSIFVVVSNPIPGA